jgi:tetratricopeptide (TPR) repeat protein
LLNKSATLEQNGDYEASIQILERTAQLIDGRSEPRLRWVLRFNQAANLGRLSRAEEAVLIVREVRELSERLRNDLDLVRTLWLEGNVAAGLGHRHEALGALEQVRRDFEARTLPYDYALASLDLALVYREEGRFTEIMTLAGQILKIFEAQRVHREALAAIVLFREAAEKEQITVDLVRRLQDYLSRAQRNPELRFDA